MGRAFGPEARIPFGNDIQESKGNGNGKRRFPSGMTDKKARALDGCLLRLFVRGEVEGVEGFGAA